MSELETSDGPQGMQAAPGKGARVFKEAHHRSTTPGPIISKVFGQKG